MTATALSLGTVYTPDINTHYVLMTAVASTSGAATRAEINAGIDYTALITDPGDFSKTGNTIDVPVMGSLDDVKLTGRNSFGTATQVTLADKLDRTVDMRSYVAQGAVKWIARMDQGDTATKLMDVFKVTAQTVSAAYPIGAATTVSLTWAIQAQWTGLAIPA